MLWQCDCSLYHSNQFPLSTLKALKWTIIYRVNGKNKQKIETENMKQKCQIHWFAEVFLPMKSSFMVYSVGLGQLQSIASQTFLADLSCLVNPSKLCSTFLHGGLLWNCIIFLRSLYGLFQCVLREWTCIKLDCVVG